VAPPQPYLSPSPPPALVDREAKLLPCLLPATVLPPLQLAAKEGVAGAEGRVGVRREARELL